MTFSWAILFLLLLDKIQNMKLEKIGQIANHIIDRTILYILDNEEYLTSKKANTNYLINYLD